MNLFKKIFCKHEWVLDRIVNKKGLYQCYCKNCLKITLKNIKGDVEH
jgi:hypothetical protein